MIQYEYNDYLVNYFTPVLLSVILLLCVIYGIKFHFIGKRKGFKGPPSPLAFPIIGHMHLLAKFPTNPWMGFNEIRKRYGNVVSLKLGQCKTVMVSSPDAIREVLLVKGHIFADRPSFYRHSLIFGRDKENSLALCDWSEMHRLRRTMAQSGILPRFGSKGYKELANCIESDVKLMINDLFDKKKVTLTKDYVLMMCANIFLSYLSSRKFSMDDKDFIKAIYKYDFVFYDINQCYAIDFIPFLSIFGFYKRYFNKVEDFANTLRKYIETEIVNPRLEETVKKLKSSDRTEPKDFLESLLESFIRNPNKMSWTVCMFEFGDLIGGHSAVGNLLMRMIGHLAVNESVQEDMHKEAKNVINKDPNNKDVINLDKRSLMPLTDACILETLRIASSPIVPHVNTEDTTLQGFDIKSGTMVLFNSYHLNMSPDYWSEPQKFNPSRFLTSKGDTTHILKPDHFLPFSCGRRACLGYKMVNTIAFTAISNLVLNFKITAQSSGESIEIKKQLTSKGSLALSAENCFKVAITPRTS